MPGFTCLVYNGAAVGVNAVNTDLVAATDPDFTQRNSHYTFTEPYKLLGASLIGASVIRGRFQAPTWNAIGEAAIFNANRALTPPTNCQLDLWKDMPPTLPVNEEFQVQVSNNLGAATEQENVVLLLGANDWNANLPRGRMTICVRYSFALTPTINAWSLGNAMTLAASLRGGVYSVVGATLQGANAIAFRINFPRYNLYQGRRKLRPGFMVQTAIGDIVNNQLDPWVLALGEWGRFHTFELPSIDVFGATAGAITYQGFLWLQYLGESENLLEQGLGGGMPLVA